MRRQSNGTRHLNRESNFINMFIGKKSNRDAQKYLEEGKKFSQLNYFDALVALNKCLILAENGSPLIAEAYLVRSDIFLTMGHFKKSLGNIQEVIKCKNLDKNILQRESECIKMMSIKNSEFDSDPKSFFTLSYPSHAKIPFIVNCLEIRRDEKFGRLVITTHPLFPGDVIAIEKSSFNFISADAIYSRCFNCLKANMLDLIPSSASGKFRIV